MNDMPGPEEPPLKICPVCSTQSRTTADECPNCGASFIRNRTVRMRRRFSGMPKRRRRIMLIGLAVVLIAGIGTAVGLKINHDNDVAAEKAADRKAAEEEAKAKEDEAQKTQEAQDNELAIRKLLVGELEKQVTKDAAGSASDGVLDGPILRTQCDPEGGVVDPAAVSQAFSCLAITSEDANGLAEGYRYTANANYQNYSYSWRLGGDALP
jgi:hypothetical protein